MPLPGNFPGEIDVQRPRKPHHSMSCAGNVTNVQEFSITFDGNAPEIDSGDPTIKYEID